MAATVDPSVLPAPIRDEATLGAQVLYKRFQKSGRRVTADDLEAALLKAFLFILLYEANHGQSPAASRTSGDPSI